MSDNHKSFETSWKIPFNEQPLAFMKFINLLLQVFQQED